jgi:hypothetical protein
LPSTKNRKSRRALPGWLGATRLIAAPAFALCATLAAFALTACGGGGCLTPAEVEREVNKIALGGEFSQAEVEAKQEEIREVRERACG